MLLSHIDAPIKTKSQKVRTWLTRIMFCNVRNVNAPTRPACKGPPANQAETLWEESASREETRTTAAVNHSQTAGPVQRPAFRLESAAIVASFRGLGTNTRISMERIVLVPQAEYRPRHDG
jgi:hypothetical protein